MAHALDASTRRRLAIPAVLFLLYVLYLAFRSPKPFLERWIEGCFAFFLALVFAYVILRNSPAGRDEGHDEDQGESGGREES